MNSTSRKESGQGGPLSPFLFLIATKGLSYLMRKAVELKEFDRIKMGKDKILISNLQFTYDTVLLGKASLKNTKCLRDILRLFEMASVLKVNFHKSSIHGMNLKN